MSQPILLNGQWRPSTANKSFRAVNPATGQPLPDEYPVSPWSEIESAIAAAARAFEEVRDWDGSKFARFLEEYAERIAARSAELVEIAQLETALPAEPRLRNVELPRTIGQLRQAAAAAREGSWALPTIDTKANLRSVHAALGPVVVFGPNNFPFAFNGMAGGDFAAAVAAGNPVIAKGHSSHPGTTRLFAQAAHEAARAAGMPHGFVQLLYRTSHEDGAKLVSHPLVGAAGYTGSREAGLVLKTAADRAGKPIYLELSSINPVVMLAGALRERGAALAEEFATSSLMGAGQFCTNPGLLILPAGPDAEAFLSAVAQKFEQATPGTLLSSGVRDNLRRAVSTIVGAGAKVVAGSGEVAGDRCCFSNTLLRVDGERFLQRPAELQAEAFGNSALVVLVSDDEQLLRVVGQLEGNLTACLYSDSAGSDDALYNRVAPPLRWKAGRLINDKMPTGVAVSPAMNHGGPFPASGHPGFTAVGIPASLRRFSMLHCYDNVRPERLPELLRDKNPTGAWRMIDGAWTQAPLS